MRSKRFEYDAAMSERFWKAEPVYPNIVRVFRARAAGGHGSGPQSGPSRAEASGGSKEAN